jgi:hypothetical protein
VFLTKYKRSVNGEVLLRLLLGSVVFILLIRFYIEPSILCLFESKLKKQRVIAYEHFRISGKGYLWEKIRGIERRLLCDVKILSAYTEMKIMKKYYQVYKLLGITDLGCLNTKIIEEDVISFLEEMSQHFEQLARIKRLRDKI